MVAAEQRRQLQMAQAAQVRLAQASPSHPAAGRGHIVGVTAVTPQADTIVAPPSTHAVS